MHLQSISRCRSATSLSARTMKRIIVFAICSEVHAVLRCISIRTNRIGAYCKVATRDRLCDDCSTSVSYPISLSMKDISNLHGVARAALAHIRATRLSVDKFTMIHLPLYPDSKRGATSALQLQATTTSELRLLTVPCRSVNTGPKPDQWEEEVQLRPPATCLNRSHECMACPVKIDFKPHMPSSKDACCTAESHAPPLGAGTLSAIECETIYRWS